MILGMVKIKKDDQYENDNHMCLHMIFPKAKVFMKIDNGYLAFTDEDSFNLYNQIVNGIKIPE